MIPFLKVRKAEGGITTQVRAPDETHEAKDEKDAGIIAAMKDFSSSFEARDYKGMSDAIRNAFDILDSEPHVEGPHLNDKDEE